MTHCNVLVVDDSATMRALIAATLHKDPAIRVVGEAADPYEARDAIKALNPDVVTLDIEMPRMNGLDFLERLMRLRPTRVIVVSSLTEKGGAATIQALETGAFDCVAKPSARDPHSFLALPAKVRAIAGAPLPRKLRGDVEAGARTATRIANYESDGRVVALGSSMGGVEALFAVLSKFPENCPPTVIAQHMPGLFTKSFASRLDRVCKPSVQEAHDGAQLAPGRVYLAPGGPAHLEVVKSGGYVCRLREGAPVSGHRPSIDVLFASVASVAGARSYGAILTGMGRDGAEGLLAMRKAGAETIGQDEASSLIYGMPRVAFEIGAVGKQYPLDRIGDQILTATNVGKARV
jgi:two-component system, chemotaxis family, protein-glutamate methylesterase/glutaminase